MAIKIDLEKAYDRLNGFVMRVLIEINLPGNLTNIIMICICTTSYDLYIIIFREEWGVK